MNVLTPPEVFLQELWTIAQSIVCSRRRRDPVRNEFEASRWELNEVWDEDASTNSGDDNADGIICRFEPGCQRLCSLACHPALYGRPPFPPDARGFPAVEHLPDVVSDSPVLQTPFAGKGRRRGNSSQGVAALRPGFALRAVVVRFAVASVLSVRGVAGSTSEHPEFAGYAFPTNRTPGVATRGSTHNSSISQTPRKRGRNNVKPL